MSAAVFCWKMRVDCGQLALRDRKFADSPLERTGFEPSIPP